MATRRQFLAKTGRGLALAGGTGSLVCGLGGASLATARTALATLPSGRARSPGPFISLPAALPISAEFKARAAGALRAYDLSQGLGPIVTGAPYPNVACYAGSAGNPTFDASLGLNAVRFDVPGKSGSNAGGEWYINFSDDLATQFGPGTTFFVQWRQRFNRAMCDTIVMQGGGNGQSAIKQVILSCQDRAAKHYDSCTLSEIVLTTYKNYRLYCLYYGCQTGTDLLDYSISGKNQFENQVGGDRCYWQQLTDGGGTVASPGIPPSCLGWVPDEWLTFQIGVDVGATIGSVSNQGIMRAAYMGSRVRLWVARNGKPSQLVHDIKADLFIEDPVTPSAYGKAWFGPYMTGKDPTIDHPLMQTWVAEFIVSKKPIRDPVVLTVPAQGTSAQAPAPAPPPASALSTLPSGCVRNLGPFVPKATWEMARTEYSCIRYEPTTRKMLLHGGPHNGACHDDLRAFSLDTLTWSSLTGITQDTSAANIDVAQSRYISTNQPEPVHTFNMSVCTRGRYYKMSNGGAAGATNNLCVFDTATGEWTWPGVRQPWYYASGAALDPKTGKIVCIGGDGSGSNWLYLHQFDPATGTVERIGVGLPQPAMMVTTTYDPVRDVFVSISGYPSATYVVQETTLDRARLANSKSVLVPTTGQQPGNSHDGMQPEAWALNSRNNTLGGCVIAGKFSTYDPASKVWSVQQMKFEDGNPAKIQQSFYCIDFDPKSGCFIFLARDFNTYAYRP